MKHSLLKYRFPLSLLLLMMTVNTLAQDHEFSIGNTRLKTTTAVKNNDWGSKDTLMHLYRFKQDKPVLLLTHTLYRYGADCNNAVTERGSMDIKADSLIFTTRTTQKTGLDPLPWLQWEVYVVSNRGTLQKVFDRVKYKGSNKWVVMKP